MGFEPTRAEHNGLAVHHLNHSVTSSDGRIANLKAFKWLITHLVQVETSKPSTMHVQAFPLLPSVLN